MIQHIKVSAHSFIHPFALLEGKSVCVVWLDSEMCILIHIHKEDRGCWYGGGTLLGR
jgi:hypothetical protein